MASYLDYDGLLHLKDKLDDTYATSEQGTKADNAIPNPTTKSNGQVLTYNGTNWVAQNPAETGVLSVTEKDETITVDNTDTANPKVSVSSTYKTKIDNAVPNTRKVNGNALSGDININATQIKIDGTSTTTVKSAIDGKQATISDLETIRTGAGLGATAVQPSALSGYVPTSRTINNKALTDDITLTPADLGLGTVFKLKGSKNTKTDLPSTGNEVGDVWYVVDESVGYIWLQDGSTYRWEKLGMEVDLSSYWAKSELIAITNAQIDNIFA